MPSTLSAFRLKPGTRRTFVDLEGEKIDLQVYYMRHSRLAVVSYQNFRVRCIGLQAKGLLSNASMVHAVEFDASRWRTRYGGGRRNSFVYTGVKFPECTGKRFWSVSAFLDTVGLSHIKPLVWSRLKAGWSLDTAMTMPASGESKRSGRIYMITRIRTGQVYVGLTLTSLKNRWAFHVWNAYRGKANTKLAQAIREDGASAFTITVVEDEIIGMTLLSDRERYWAEKLNAYGESGLNVSVAGGLGGVRGIPVLIGLERFRSKNEATEVIGARLGIAPSVILSRLNQGKPIPNAEEVRRHSRHPDAGSKMFRQWLALLRRYPDAVEDHWVASYDYFKADVMPAPKNKELVRCDNSKPWGRRNFRWVSNQEKMEINHGKSVEIKGIVYPTLKAAANAYGIGVSTLKDRVRRQGLSFDAAVTLPLAATSYRVAGSAVIVDGQVFRSKRQAILHIAKTRGWTEGQAKYRFATGLF